MTSPHPEQQKKNWTRGEDAVLRACVAERLTYELIAKKIGRSRNAVSGRVDRLGIGLGRKPKVRRLSPPSTTGRGGARFPLWDERLTEPYADFKVRKARERAIKAEVRA